MVTSVIAAGGIGGVAAAEQVASEGVECDVTVLSGESIQNAVNGANVGETVCVEDGVYDEEVIIGTGGVTLTAAEGATPVLDGDGFAGVTVDASGVTVDGFEIRGYNLGISVLDDANSLVVRNSLLTENDVGIELREVDGAVLDHNTITANTENGIEFSPFSTQENVEITNNELSHNRFHAIRAEYRFDAVETLLLENNTITNNLGTSSSPAIALERTMDATIVNNTVSDNGQIGISLREFSNDAIVEGNEVINNSRGIHLNNANSAEIRDNTIEQTLGSAIWFRDSDSVTIVGNELGDNQRGITTAGTSTGLTVESNTVSSERLDLHLGTVTDATVTDNTFETGVRVTGGVNPEKAHFRHEFGGNTVGDDPLVYVTDEDTPDIDPDAGQIIVANSTNVDISGFDLSGVPTAIHIAYSDGAEVTDNTVTDGVEFGDGGIVVTESAGVLVDNNDVANVRYGIQFVGGTGSTVSNNTVSDTGTGAGGETMMGVLLERDGQDHVVRNNTITGVREDGIHVRNGVDGTLIESNTVESSVRDGVHIRWNSHNTVVRDNTLSSNGEQGVFVERAEHTTIEHNEIRENNHGIIAGRDVDHLTVEENSITQNNLQGVGLEPPGPFTGGDAPSDVNITSNEIVNNRLGISIDEATAVQVVKNTVTDNGYIDQWGFIRGGGVDVSDSATTTVANNSIVDNVAGITVSGDEVDARFNWWGAENGPSGSVEDPETGTAADGDGDSVDENVRFDPWLTSSPTAGPPDGSDGAFFELSSVSTDSPVNAGDDLTVDVTVTNTGDVEGTQTVKLEDFDGTVVDSMDVTLPDSTDEQLSLTWATQASDAGTGDITVRSENDSVTEQVSITSDDPITVGECTIIDTPGTYLLDDDLAGSTTCLQITSSDVTFDGMGHTIQGDDLDDSENQFGILVHNHDERLENVVVRNVTVDGWDFGVRLWDVDDSDVTDVTAENSGSGVSLLGANSNELSNIETQNNSFRSVILSNSGQNALSDIESTNDQVDARYSTRGAIYVFSSNQNEFENVDVSGSFAGIRVSFGLGNSFTGVTATDNANYGIEVGSNNNQFQNVSTVGNGWHGIKVQTASSNHFENVNVSDTDGSGIRLTSIGGSGSAPTWNVFENVTATDNDGSAISLTGSSNNQFQNLTLHSNAGAAVNFVSNSQGNLVEGGEVDQGSYQALNFGSNSVDNTVRDVALLGTGTAFSAQDGDPNNVAERLDINGTVVSFAALGASVSPADPGTVPDGATPLDRYLEVSAAAPGTHVEYLHFHYEPADVDSVDESALGVWQLTDEWQSPDTGSYDSGVNTTDRYVFAENVTETGTYGVFAEGPQPTLAVTNASLSSTQLEAGDTVTVTADVENVGAVAGDLVVTLEIDGSVVDSKTVTLDVNETAEVTFTHTFDTEGTYEVSVSSEHVGTVSVSEELVADIVVFGGSVDPETVDVAGDETVTVTGDLYNQGSAGGEKTIALTADGDVVDEVTVSLAAGEVNRSAVTFEWTPGSDVLDDETSVDIELMLDGFVVGVVTVEERYSDIQVIAASTSEAELVAGEDFYTVGSIYQAGTIDGPQNISLTATNQDTGEQLHLATQEVSLSPGFYHLGALNVTTTIDQAGTYDLELGDRAAGTVEVAAAESDIQVIAASISDIELVAGEEFYTIGSIYQAGTIDGPQNISLTATNQATNETVTLATESRTLAPGYYHLGALNLTTTIDEAGTYDITLGDRDAGTVEVAAAESDIQVIAASVSQLELVAGEEFYTVGSIYQAGNVDGPQDVELTATNQETNETLTLATEEVTLTPGYYHLGALNITTTIDEAGTYDLELGDRAAGTVEVAAAESDIQVIAASVSQLELVAGEEFYTVGSIYQAGTVDGPQDIELTATNQATNETVTLATEEVTLTPGYYHLGALNITTTIDEAGTYDLELGGRTAGTLEVEPAISDIQVIATSPSDVEVFQDEEFYVVGSIYQAGNVDGPQDITLTATNQDTGEQLHLGTQEVSLSPGFYHLGALNITTSIEDAGEYDLELGERAVGTISVEEVVSDIRVIGASLEAVELVEGETTHVTGSIYQNGSTTATEEIELVATNQDTGETEVVGSQEVTLDPGYYHLGALNISFTPETAGTYDLELGDIDAGTIEVEEAISDIQVIAASVSQLELVAGEEFYTVGSIYQAGTIDGPQEINLTATNQATNETVTLATESRTLAPGYYHLGALNLTTSLEEAGTYDITLGDRDAGTVEVAAAESDIQVIAASVSQLELVAGEEFYTVGSIYQAGTIDDPQDIELTATNQDTGEQLHLATQEVSLSPGFYHLGALNLTTAIDEAGTYDITLGDRDAGTVEVAAAESDIQVIAASASITEVAQTETFFAIGSIYQAGTIDGPQEINLTATNQDTGEQLHLGAQEVSLSPGFYHLGALNVTTAIDEVGTYDLEFGDRNAGTVEVVPPALDVSIATVSGYSTDVDPETEDETVYASDDATVKLEVDADLDIEEVVVLVSSLETTYSIGVDAEHVTGDTWRATIPLDQLPDDGQYRLSAIGVDVLGNADSDLAEVTLAIDRDVPSMAASFEDVDGDDATVVVESDEPLATPPDVTVELPDGQTMTVALAQTSYTEFVGTLEFGDSGNYTVEAVGTDRAGNEGTDTASVVVDTRFTLEDGAIALGQTGTSITFNLADDVDDAIKSQELYIALSETTANTNLDDGDIGVGFLTAELDGLLEYHIQQGTVESATISMAVDEDALGDLPAEDVELHHYDEAEDTWTPVDSTVTGTDTDLFVVADVTGFSTYGALVPDTEPPALVGVSPEPDEVVDGDEVTVQFEYTDTHSGIDVTAVEMSVDGVDVTDADGTQITSEAAAHTFGVEPETEYTVAVTVADMAGNEETFETTVQTASSSDEPPDPSPTPDPSPSPDPAEFVVTIQSAPDAVDAGETIDVSVGIENVGDEAAEQAIELFVDGAAVDTATVDLDGGETATVLLSYTTDDADVPELELVVSSEDTSASYTVAVTTHDDTDDSATAPDDGAGDDDAPGDTDSADDSGQVTPEPGAEDDAADDSAADTPADDSTAPADDGADTPADGEKTDDVDDTTPADDVDDTTPADDADGAGTDDADDSGPGLGAGVAFVALLFVSLLVFQRTRSVSE